MSLPIVDIYDATLNDTGIVPTGYRILVEIPTKEEKTKGGIFIPQDVKKAEEIASLCGRVLQLGPLAYLDSDKFDGSSWCKPGDYIVMAAYTGTRVRVPGDSREFRLINDDSVIALVPSPNGVERA